MALGQLQSETESVPFPRESVIFSDSGSEEYPRSHPEACGEAEPGDVDPGERSAGGNPGWADAMAKVLRTNKPKRKRSVVLSKARRIQDVGSEKLLMDPGFQIDGDGETGVDTHLEPRKRKKLWENKGRVKPDVLDRNRERTLAKIATKGVIQLFNAVREHQKTLDSRIREAGKSELKREKILKSVDKKSFLDVLGGSCKTKMVVKDSELKPVTWKVLREDFMMGARLKDWDKEDQDEDTKL